MNILSFVGIGIIGAVLSVVIKQYKPEFAIYITLGAGMLILGSAVSLLSPAVSQIIEYMSFIENGSAYSEILLKSLAVCYITQIASDCCNDAGEGAIASKIELAGKCTLVILALPLFTSITDMIKNLMS